MKFQSIAMLTALAGFSSFATAQEIDQTIARGAAPDWAELSPLLEVPQDATGLVFFRRQDTIVRLDPTGQTIFLSQRVKLLNPQALQLGNIQIAWNPAVGTPTVHALLIHRDGEEINVLDTAQFEILRREDQLDQAMLTGMLTAVLRVPDLRVEDELEISYSLPSADPTLGDTSFGALTLAHAPSPGRFRLGLSWTSGQQPNIRLTDDFKPLVETTDNELNLRVDDPEAVSPPRDAPLRYSWLRVIEYSDFDRWEDLSRRFAKLFRDAAELEADSPLKQEAARIAAKYSSDADRAAAVLKLVQQQVRYIYVGLNGGNLSPVSADKTWKQRYGDCKGKTALLLALLTELGIEAEAVLVNNGGLDDGFDERLPSPFHFDHVLVRAKIGDRTMWMDGTLPPVAQATADPIIPYRWVLPLSLSLVVPSKTSRKSHMPCRKRWESMKLTQAEVSMFRPPSPTHPLYVASTA